MLDEEMDHMDQMIREAANNHHPAYNDKAWEKMELQLDKHLPQKKDRRRLIFFLLLFLLAGGAGTLFLLNNRPGNEKAIAAGKTNDPKNEKGATTSDYTAQDPKNIGEEVKLSENTSNTDDNQQSVASGNSDNLKTTTAQNVTHPSADADNSKAPTPPANNNDKAVTPKQLPVAKTRQQRNNTSPGTGYTDGIYNNNDAKVLNKQVAVNRPKTQQTSKKNNYTVSGESTKDIDEISTTSKKKAGNKSATKARITAADPSEDMEANEVLAYKKKTISGNEDPKLKVSITSPGTTSEDIAASTLAPAEANEDKKVTATKNDKEPVKDSAKSGEDKKLVAADKKTNSTSGKKQKKNKFSNNFGITFSAGPDMSFVKLNNTGKTTFTYGAGISYGFAKRFTARAGFYVSKKIYEATPEQYHTPGGNYPYLTDVDADCRIYEIPLSLSYSFGQRKKHNWFGSVGLSSFIMKKEDYVYNYKTPNGQTFNYYYTANNQNKHYFSVLNLSAGYQYHFNKWVSLQAEPYLQVPLGGVGMGKIKLNSAGVLFTVTVKPFAKKK